MADGTELKKVFELCSPDEDGYILTGFLADKLAEQFCDKDIDALKGVLDPKRKGRLSFDQFKVAISDIQEYSNQASNLSDGLAINGNNKLNDESDSEVLQYDKNVQQVGHVPEITFQSKMNSPSHKDDCSSSSDPENTYNEYDVPDGDDMAYSINGDDIMESFEAMGESPNLTQRRNTVHLGLPTPPETMFRRRSNVRRSHRRSHSLTSREISLGISAGDQKYQDETESVTSDLEEISEKVDILQDQFAKLTEEKKLQAQYEAVNSEKQQLALRNHELEERLVNLEGKIKYLKRDHGEKLHDMHNKLTREHQLVLEVLQGKLQSAEKESDRLIGELGEVKGLFNKSKKEEASLQTKVDALTSQVMQTNEEYRRLNNQSSSQRERAEEERVLLQEVNEKLRSELEEMSIEKTVLADRLATIDQSPSTSMLSAKLHNMEIENEQLRTANEDLNVQLARNIVDARTLIDASVASDSIATELASASRDEVMETLRRKKQENLQLREYLDKIILSALEKDPSILEVK